MGQPVRHPRGVLPPGTRVERFELLRRLAKGGMAELYLARAHGIHGFEKLVVVKLVLPHLAEDRDFVEMFLHEARLAGTLDHPNIVHVTDIGEVNGEPFFVMEYVHGQDARAILRATSRSDRTVPLDCALTICAGVATGLHYMHERRGSDGRFLGLVHRDVSPSNVVVSYDGGVKLVDFGIAKATELHHATRTGVLKGKVNYMAPEQCHGTDIDRRTDIFAVGILLYELTTGRRLFPGDNDFYVMSRIVRGLYARPTELSADYPPELEEIMLRALAIDPDDRYPTAQDLLADIEGFAQDHRIRLSALGVASHLRELFGEQPHPADVDADDHAPTVIHPDRVGSDPARAAPTTAAIAPTGVVPAMPRAEPVDADELPTAPAADATVRVEAPPDDELPTAVATPATPTTTTVVAPGPAANVTTVVAPPPVAPSSVRVAPPRSSRGILFAGLAIAAACAFVIGMLAGRANEPRVATEPTPTAQPAVATPAPAAAPETNVHTPAEPPAVETPSEMPAVSTSPGTDPLQTPPPVEPVDATAPAQAEPEAEAPSPPRREPKKRKRRTRPKSHEPAAKTTPKRPKTPRSDLDQLSPRSARE